MNSKPKSAKQSNGAKSKSTLEVILSSMPSGRRLALSYARQIALTGEDERWKKLMALHDSNTRTDLADLCDEVGLPYADFFAEINREMYPFTEQASKFARATSVAIVGRHLPRVVERGMLEAAKPEGIADRHYHLQNEGFHVAPKGINLQMNQVQGMQMQGLPSFEDAAKKVDGALQQPQLTEGDEEYIDLDMIEEEERVA